MAITFTPAAGKQQDVESLGSLLCLVGTLTFSGSYATGGETLRLDKLFGKIGRGQVLGILTDLRGHTPEYDPATNKVKLYSAASTELAAAAYNATLTASPVPVIIIGR
jgi:hypothetical protein